MNRGAGMKNFFLKTIFKKPWGERRTFPEFAPKSFNELWRKTWRPQINYSGLFFCFRPLLRHRLLSLKRRERSKLTTIAITHATIWVDENLHYSDATLLLKDGVVAACETIFPFLYAPVIDIKGAYDPSFIDPFSTYGIQPVKEARQ